MVSLTVILSISGVPHNALEAKKAMTGIFRLQAK